VVAPWDDEAAPWESCAAVLIRSPWDYHERVDEFLAWADRIEGDGTPVWNPAAMIAWNARKTYLRELEAAGVATVPTLWLEGDDPSEWPGRIAAAGWDDMVIKPIVGASSFLTWRMGRDWTTAGADRFERLAAHGGALVQPFVTELPTAGEWSLVYFEGRFSHAVRKRARPGEFRVQIEFGGSETPEEPATGLEAAARAVLDTLPGVPLYARVDGIELEGQLVLTELELIEPVLYLGIADGAASRFASAVACRLAAS
jgi:hypothetical protein